MKKTLVAMAALSALSAMAQSTVTLYGNIDYSYTLSPEKVETSGTGIATTTTKTTALRAVGANRNFSSNAIGFRGTEDLGNGLKANFQVETAITGNQGDGGTGSTTLFSNNGANSTRDTWVGLSGGFGEVRVGHQSTHEFAKNGLAEAGSVNLIQNLNGLAGFGRQGRHDMISYVTPSFNGLSGTIQWGKAGVKGTSSATTQDTQNARSHMNLGLDYTNGPLVLAAGQRTGKTMADGTGAASANLSIDQSGLTTVINTAAIAGNTFNVEAKTKANYIYANYNLGAAKVFAGYSTHKATLGGAIAGVQQNGFTNKSKQTNIGVQVPMGAFTPWVSIARGKQYENDTATGAQTAWGSDKLKTMSLGTTYAMSKRTSMYAVYNTLKIDTNFEANANTIKSKTTQTLVGIRHQF